MATTTKEKVYNYATEARNELRDKGYREYWCVEKNRGQMIVTYFTDGRGHMILLTERLDAGAERCSWEMYRQLTPSTKVTDTFAALAEYTGEVQVDA